MAEILFVTWGGGGNVPPAIDIALELAGAGTACAPWGTRPGASPWRRPASRSSPPSKHGRSRPATRSRRSPCSGCSPTAVERAGAGRVVATKAGVDELRSVITDLLADGPHRRAAQRLGAAIRAMPGAVNGADAVEGVLRNGAKEPGRPAVRP